MNPMTVSRNVLTPEALTMMDAIARSGSFAAAARELGKVPSALTYNVRQLEDALDVLLFDRRSRQATLTAAGRELLDEGRHLLEQMDAVASRVALKEPASATFSFVVAPHHPLAAAKGPLADAEIVRHRAIAVADSAHRLAPATVNLLAGQDVLTVSDMQAKIEALTRGVG